MRGDWVWCEAGLTIKSSFWKKCWHLLRGFNKFLMRTRTWLRDKQNWFSLLDFMMTIKSMKNLRCVTHVALHGFVVKSSQLSSYFISRTWPVPCLSFHSLTLHTFHFPPSLPESLTHGPRHYPIPEMSWGAVIVMRRRRGRGSRQDKGQPTLSGVCPGNK